MTYKCPNCRAELDVVEVLPVREIKPQVQPQSGGGADAAGAPYGVDNYGRPFKTQAEADDYFRRDAEREANLDGSDAVKQAELQPGAQDVRTFDVPQLEWVLQNINAVLSNHGSTHGPMKALHELSALMQASGITDAGNGYIVPPASFPQLSALTVQRAKELAGLA
jgi:hypothetical protein